MLYVIPAILGKLCLGCFVPGKDGRLCTGGFYGNLDDALVSLPAKPFHASASDTAGGVIPTVLGVS